jgi:hypothetical protein
VSFHGGVEAVIEEMRDRPVIGPAVACAEKARVARVSDHPPERDEDACGQNDNRGRNDSHAPRTRRERFGLGENRRGMLVGRGRLLDIGLAPLFARVFHKGLQK